MCGSSVPPSLSVLYFHDLFSAHGCEISSILVPNYLSLAATSVPLITPGSSSLLCLSCSFTFSSLSLSKFDHFYRDSDSPHRQGEGYWGICFLGRKTSGFTGWIKAAGLVKQWMNVQSKLCKRVWINLAPLAQTTPHRWKLFLLDGSVLEATWKYVGLLDVPRLVCEDLYLIMVPASTTKAFTHKDVVYMYTHTRTQTHTLGARDVLWIVLGNSADVITNMFILALVLGKLTLPCCWTGKKKSFHITYPAYKLLTKEKEALAGKKWECPKILVPCFSRCNFCLEAFLSMTWVHFIQGQLLVEHTGFAQKMW